MRQIDLSFVHGRDHTRLVCEQVKVNGRPASRGPTSTETNFDHEDGDLPETGFNNKMSGPSRRRTKGCSFPSPRGEYPSPYKFDGDSNWDL